jgi:hypothetical protein
MAISEAEVKALLTQASPNAPGDDSNAPPTPPLTAASPGTAAGVDALKTPNAGITAPAAASPINASPTPNFSERYGTGLRDQLMKALANPANGKQLSVMAPFVTAAIPALSGGDAWDRATSNADASTPTTPPAGPPNKALGAVNAVGASLGDAANAVGPGGGFGAIARTLAARSGRLSDEMKNRQLMATSNAQMLHEQALTHKLGEDQIAAAATSGKQGADLMLNSHVPGELIAEGKTSDELKDMIAKKELDPTIETVFLTGRQLVGKDANGQPLFRSTYSVVKPGGPVKFDEDHKDELDFINDNLHMNIKPGQELPAIQVNHLWQQAQNAAVTNAQLEANLAEIGLKRDKAELAKGAMHLNDDNYITNAMAANNASVAGHQDPYVTMKTYYALLNNPEAMKKYPNFPELYKQWVGEKNFDILQKDYDKAQNDAEKKALNIVGMTNEQIGEHPGSAIAAADMIINAPKGKYTDLQVQQAVDTKKQAQIALGINTKAAGDKTKEEERAKGEVAAEGFTDSQMDAALHYKLDPETLAGIRGSQREALMGKLLDEAKKRGIDWSEAEYKRRFNTVQDFSSKGASGQQIYHLGTFARHAGLADDLIDGLANTNYQDLNKPLNTLQEHMGSAKYAQMRTAIGAAAKGYLDFLNAGHALTTQDQEWVNQLTDENAAPGKIRGVLQEMAETAGARTGELNKQYKDAFDGKDYPAMFSKRSYDVLKKLGVDLSDAGGISGNFAPTPQNQPTPKPGAQAQRPADVPTATGAAPDPRTNKMYWHDASGKVLREVKPGELPQ